MAQTDNNVSQRILKGWQRVLVGSLGGLAAIAVKYLSEDHANVLSILTAHDQNAIDDLSGLDKYIIGYAIFAPITIFLGAVIGWISEESVRIKLFAIGVSAPALLTTWANPPADAPSSASLRNDTVHTFPSLVSSAWAFGESGGEQLFVVQVGAFSQPELARQLADQINQDPTLRAFTVEHETANGTMIRVWVTRFLPLEDALSVREHLLNEGIVSAAIVVDISATAD